MVDATPNKDDGGGSCCGSTKAWIVLFCILVTVAAMFTDWKEINLGDMVEVTVISKDSSEGVSMENSRLKQELEKAKNQINLLKNMKVTTEVSTVSRMEFNDDKEEEEEEKEKEAKPSTAQKEEIVAAAELLPKATTTKMSAASTKRKRKKRVPKKKKVAPKKSQPTEPAVQQQQQQQQQETLPEAPVQEAPEDKEEPKQQEDIPAPATSEEKEQEEEKEDDEEEEEEEEPAASPEKTEEVMTDEELKELEDELEADFEEDEAAAAAASSQQVVDPNALENLQLPADGSLPPYYVPLGDRQNLWDGNAEIPQYIKEYLQWHKEQRAKMNEKNWKDFLYGVNVALHGKTVGGTTDRIRGLPALLSRAARSEPRRILLIYWTRPYALEHYLMPPKGGLDWRVPHYMVRAVNRLRAYYRNPNAVPIGHYTTMGGGDYGDHKGYNKWSPQPATDVFRSLWNVVYTPSPPVAKLVADRFTEYGISPGEFGTAHMRAHYKVHRDKESLTKFVQNAMRCISQLQPGGPYYVASDTAKAFEIAEDYGRQHNVTVYYAPLDANPRHISFWNKSDTSLKPSDWYDGFVDILMMSETGCTSFGPGGFGQWGRWMGYIRNCSKRQKHRCTTWRDPPKGHSPPRSDPPRLPQYPEPFRPTEQPNTARARQWGPKPRLKTWRHLRRLLKAHYL